MRNSSAGDAARKVHRAAAGTAEHGRNAFSPCGVISWRSIRASATPVSVSASTPRNGEQKKTSDRKHHEGLTGLRPAKL